MSESNSDSNQNDSRLFTFESSQEDFYQLLSLFESGELSKLLGVEIVDVGAISESQLENRATAIVSSRRAVLSQWLQRVYESSWLTVDELLGTPESRLAFGARSSPDSRQDSSSTPRSREVLSEIDLQNPDAVESLIDLLGSEQDEETRLSIIECLARVAPGNTEASNALVQLLRTSWWNDNILQQAAESLGQVGEGNDDEIGVLVQLIHTSPNNRTRWQAALSLGKIAPTHPEGAVRRAKKLGLQLAGYSVILLVYVKRETERERLVLVQVCPPRHQIVLPPNLQLAILDNTEEVLIDEVSGNADRYMQLSFTGEMGDLFNIKVALGNESIIENCQI